MRDRILALLKDKEGYISGEDLSSSLKISRQALWKHIQELKEEGYDIEAVPHLGYQLSGAPDRLFPSEVSHGLNTKFIGNKIHYFESIDSTMNAAAQLGLQGAGEGALILAESQAKGRGRLGRTWFSPKHKGIYFSLILRPKILPSQAPVLTLLAAVSICEAIKETTGLGPEIKWPNDILLGNKKLGGILTELSAETDKVNFVVIGAGLNINNPKKELISGSTSLKEHKKENINRIQLLQAVLRRIEENYLIFGKKGSASIIEKWRECSITLGRRVKVYCQKEHIEGEAMDIDSDGGLLVRKDSGLIRKVMSGDVVHCR